MIRHKIVRNFGSAVGPIFKKLECYWSVYLKLQSLLHVFKTCSDWITLFSTCSLWYGFRSGANAIGHSREHDLNRAQSVDRILSISNNFDGVSCAAVTANKPAKKRPSHSQFFFVYFLVSIVVVVALSSLLVLPRNS